MPLLPREANLTIHSTNSKNITLTDVLSANAKDFQFPEMEKRELSWFARVLERIPGYTWLRIKIGRAIFGPTYEMTPEELIGHFKKIAEEERQEAERQEKEAQLKVQKFMALHYPDWYFKKHVYPHKPGSEERKRAVFIFALTNKERHGKYWSRMKDFGRVKSELDNMGVALNGWDIVKALMEGVAVNETSVTNRKERRHVVDELRDDLELAVPEGELDVYQSAKNMVAKTCIVGLKDPRYYKPTPGRGDAVRGDTERPLVWGEEQIATAKYD